MSSIQLQWNSVKMLAMGFVGVIAGLFLLAPLQAHGQLSPENPFKDAQDTGSAEEVNVIGTDTGQDDALVNVIRGFVNRVLGVMGLIALIILLYGGFLMVTAAGNGERYDKGFTILKHAAIGLVLIGIAWFVISIIFWLINLTGEEASPAGTES